MLTIYGVYRSRAARNVWLAKEMGLEYRQVPVIQRYKLGDTPPSGVVHTQSPEFLAINPAGLIPAVEDDGVVLTESLAINLYLARKYGGPCGPASPAEDGLMLQWTLWAATEVELHSILILQQMVMKPEHERDAALLARAIDGMRAPLALLEAALASNDWLVGGRFTVADLNVAEVIRYAMPEKALFEAAPHVVRWLGACHARPGFKAMMALREAEPA